MAFRILTTKSFEQALKRHPHPHIVYQKIQLLAENPYHPSLKGHRLKQIKDKNVWDAYISDSERILYEHKGEILHLWDLGSHSVVDKAHVHIYSQHKLTKPFNILQRNFDAPVPPLLDEKHENEKYEGDRDNDYFATSSPLFPSLDLSEQTLVIDETQNEEIEEEIQYKPINHFQFFEDAHLRILGVPANLIQDVKHALSTDDALLGLTDLPEETRTRLLEAYTSQDLQISMFDESLLVHHTDLDQLNSFCGGKIKQLMLNLETEQQKYVDMDYPPAIIYGTAGSGKTAVALYRAIRLAQEGQDVLLLTFSSRLSQETKKLIISILGYMPNNLEVTTFHAAMLTLLQKVGVDVQVEEEKENGKQSIYSELIGEAILDIQKDYPTVAFLKDKTSSQVKRFVQEEIRYMIKGSDRTTWEKYKTEIRKGRKRFDPKEREAMWRIYKAYQYRLDYSGFDDWVDISTLVIHNIQNYHDSRHYDAIIVDETQDLTLVDIQVVKQVALALSSINGKACNLLLLLDPLQKVYSQGSSWESAGIHARGRTRKLKKNFRNTRQIAEAATYLLDNNLKIDKVEEYIKPELSQRHGPPPMLVKEKNLRNQIMWIKNTIKDLISDGTFRLSDFAVLCRNNKFCIECCKELNNFGLPAVLNTQHFNLFKDQIKVLTVHSAKGLEFPVVFVHGLVKGSFPPNLGFNLDDESINQLVDIEKERTLCYVAMTRASDALYLMSVKGAESLFIQELEGKFISW